MGMPAGTGTWGLLEEVTVTVEMAVDMAADIGTGCVGREMDVARGEVDGMEIVGGAALGSRSTCFVVPISEGGIG